MTLSSYGNSNYTELFLDENGIESMVDVSEEGDLPIQNIEVCSSEGGSVFGSGQHCKGSYVILNAIAKEGYKFIGWYIGEKLISEKENYGFSAMNDVKIIGKFQKRIIIQVLLER